MRSSSAKTFLYEVEIPNGYRFLRLRDRGHNQWPAARLEAAARKGFDGVVYLNRFEGVPLTEIDAILASKRNPDDLSDAVFQRLAPSAADSFIVFEPISIAIVRIHRKSKQYGLTAHALAA